MDKLEKLKLMDKILREIEDTKNSQTSLVKKIAQIETENINLGDAVLEKQIPEVFDHVDQALTLITTLQEEFSTKREQFVKDNKLEPVETV